MLERGNSRRYYRAVGQPRPHRGTCRAYARGVRVGLDTIGWSVSVHVRRGVVRTGDFDRRSRFSSAAESGTKVVASRHFLDNLGGFFLRR
ncbi:hypothetical protein CERSUDRAFT_120313 [Gelatoporia subvermispora B]|uniref:Uncharacterized protein n=1 Tax=Ceriporiopsis subvermispora (strain B) TaxID=914234 RepID=M2QFG6_CERS8|nr:hypothetical protein CERSUDRAFT_120313 [Gelatoporia subvermispora B]